MPCSVDERACIGSRQKASYVFKRQVHFFEHTNAVMICLRLFTVAVKNVITCEELVQRGWLCIYLWYRKKVPFFVSSLVFLQNIF